MGFRLAGADDSKQIVFLLGVRHNHESSGRRETHHDDIEVRAKFPSIPYLTPTPIPRSVHMRHDWTIKLVAWREAVLRDV
jgi:hypothetical protein